MKCYINVPQQSVETWVHSQSPVFGEDSWKDCRFSYVLIKLCLVIQVTEDILKPDTIFPSFYVY